MSQPTAEEQLYLELINETRLDPLASAARYISAYAPLTASDAEIQSALTFFRVDGAALQAAFAALPPVGPLAWNDALGSAAEKHSAAMIAADEQSHQLPGEASLGARISAEGYAWSTAGENIYAYSESTLYGHAGFMVDWGNGPGGMQSPAGHRDNIMRANFREVGIDVTSELNSVTAVGPQVVTQDFAARTGKYFVLGVAYSDADANRFYSVGEGRGDLTVRVGGRETTSAASGGYSLEVGLGTTIVTLSGGGLATPVTLATVIGSENLKLDVVDGGMLLSSGSLTLTGGAISVLRGLGGRGLSLAAGAGDQTIEGTSGDDTLSGGAGNDTLSGGAGNDVAVFSGSRHDYAIKAEGDGYLLVDRRAGGGDGSDRVHGFEQFRFSDGSRSAADVLTLPVRPFASPDTASTGAGTAVTIAVLDNDSDENGDVLSITAITNPANGTVAANGDGTITYIPELGFSGQDAFAYTVSDGAGGSDTAIVTIDVAAPAHVVTVHHGYIEGATVFSDDNGSGVLDSGEAAGVTDAQGRAGLGSTAGVLIATGGKDVLNDLPLQVTLKAPADSGVINPLTTLLVSMLEQGTPGAEAKLLAGLGLESDIDLRTYDAVAWTGAGDIDGAEAFLRGSQIYSTVVGFAKLLANSPRVADVIEALVGEIAEKLATGALDFEDAAALEVLFRGALADVGASEPAGISNAAQDIAQANAAQWDLLGGPINAQLLTASAEAEAELLVRELAALNDRMTITEGRIAQIDLLANDTAPIGGRLSLTTVGTPANGVAAVESSGAITYTPALGFTGTDTFSYSIADGNGGSDTATVTVQVLPSYRLVSVNGFAGAIGGTGDVFGTSGFQDVTILDAPGRVNLDTSFNAGGDIVRLSGDASDFTISRSGSNVILSDGDTTVSIPVGAVGLALVFDDGVRNLGIDQASASVKIGLQTIATSPAQVVAAPDGTALPTGAIADATARLVLSPQGKVQAGGDLNIFGTSAGEDAMLLRGDAVLDTSFNAGGDRLALAGNAQDYTAYRSGSTMIIASSDTSVRIPIGVLGLTLDFGADERSLRYDAGSGNFLIGDQIIASTDPGAAIHLQVHSFA